MDPIELSNFLIRQVRLFNSRMPELQEGIYYRSQPKIGNSFCIITLKSSNNSAIQDIGRLIYLIWTRLGRLKKGIVEDLNVDLAHRKKGNLSTLIGFGPKIFDLRDAKRNRPINFNESWNFKSPETGGGGTIINGSELKYSQNIGENHLLYDEILFQFIAENGFYTTRAAVEIWKEILKWKKKTGNIPLTITGLYTGFQRPDQRNWQGFHDGLSNLKSYERRHVISIPDQYTLPQDKWTLQGTYLAFMRIAIDLELWENTKINDQEKLVGRNKLTGCPLIGVDRNGNAIKDPRCPIPGTTEVIDRGNEYFREYSGHRIKIQDKTLQNSHIRSTRPIDHVPVWHNKSSRIFRQGFEFLEPSKSYPGFVPGLNFVSFQNSPERLFRALTYAVGPKSKTDKHKDSHSLEQYFTVLSAGIFFVPPIVRDEPFPGSTIFFNNMEFRKLMRIQV